MIKIIRFVYFIPLILLFGSFFTINRYESSLQTVYNTYNIISYSSLAILGIFLSVKPLTYIRHVGLWDDDEITSSKILTIRCTGALCIGVSIFSFYISIQ